MTDQPETNLTGPYYAVCDIETAIIVYNGMSTNGLRHLIPGRCWGRGWTTEAAIRMANEWREWFAARRKEREPKQ